MIIITVAKKPSKKATTDCAIENGCGSLNIDDCRVHGDDLSLPKYTEGRKAGWRSEEDYVGGSEAKYPTVWSPSSGGRFPANLLLNTISQEAMDTQSGNCRSNHNKSNDKAGHQNQYVGGKIHKKVASSCYTDSGGASRYFKVF